MLHRLAEAALRGYSRIAPDERGSYRLVRLLRRLRPRQLWRDVFRTPSGLHLELDLSVYPDCCMAFGLYELATARLLRQLTPPGALVIDAGANLGYFTLLLAQAVGAAGHVLAFEAEPGNAARLRGHVQRHGELAARITIHEAALAAQPGVLRIHRYAGAGAQFNHGCSTLYPQAGAATDAHDVPAVTLDDIVGDRQPALIKLDVEGAEPGVIAGAARVLQEAAPALVGELNPPIAQQAGTRPEAWVEAALAIQPRYEVWLVTRKLRRLDPQHVDWRALGQCNLLLRQP